MGLSRIVSEINGDFCRKSPQKSHARVFCALADGVSLGNGYRRKGSKKLERWGYQMVPWRFGVAVTRWSRSTQLLYIEPG